jgi:AcrR family transcriptional regulator
MKTSRVIPGNTTTKPNRRRDAIETKKAILRSARTAFAQFGYDGVGVREIAKGAGVTGILVNRYFGSKENLFSEVIASTMESPGILTQQTLRPSRERPEICKKIATALVLKTSPESEQLDGFLILLRSASNPRAALIWRERIEKHYEVSLSRALSGPKKKERAGLILAVIAGVQILRQAICITSLSEASPDWLIERLAHLLESVAS